jgi:ATP-dependent RNA helicase DeaD
MHSARVPSQDEILQILRRAGFASLTPFQQGLIPLLLKARDAVAEVPDGAGTSTAIAAMLVLALRGAGRALRALIIVPDGDSVGKVARAFTRVSRAVRDAPAFVPLGAIEDTRREQRRLEREATVTVGTAGRVIYHIRRGSLSFSSLETVILREPGPEALADFVKDVQFIVEKWTERPRIVLLARAPLREDNELLPLLHHPLSMDVQDRDGSDGAPGAHVAIIAEGSPSAESLARVVLGMRLPPVLVFHSPKTDVGSVVEVLRFRGLRAAILPQGGRQQADRKDALLALARHALDVLLVPLASGIIAPDLDDLAPSHVLFFEFPTSPLRSPGGMMKRAVIIALGEREKDLGRLQEATGVAFEKKELPDDDALLTGAIDRILRRMQGEDKADLVRLRKRIRRQVPLLLRPLFMASLLKSQLSIPSVATATHPRVASTGRQRSSSATLPQVSTSEVPIPPRGHRGRFGRSTPEPGGPSKPSEGPRTSKAETRADGDYAQLFVSVGRNRRVYARDLTELFTEKLQLVSGEIRGVRVFDKYSFVDIARPKAEEAISKLSGLEVKGRPITVNYAKKKEEKEAT